MSRICQCWFLCCFFMNAHKQVNDCIYTDRSVARKAARITRQVRARVGWSRSLNTAERQQKPWASVSRTAVGSSHRGFHTDSLCFGEQGRCEWETTCQNTTTVCLLQHNPSLRVLPFHTTLLSQLVPHLHFGKATAWKTESHQVAERTLCEDFGTWNFYHFEALRECTGVLLAGFWVDAWIYPGFQVTQSLGNQKTPRIAQNGRDFVDTSNEHAAGRGFILDFLSLMLTLITGQNH